MNRVLFRVDFGRGAGLGHVRRCLSLAPALKSWDVESVFLSNGHGAPGHAGAEAFRGETLDGIPSWSEDDLEAAVALALRRQCEAVVVDSHEVAAGYLGALRRAGLFVIARDDLAGYPFPCQMVINGNSNARELPYRSASGDTRHGGINVHPCLYAYKGANPIGRLLKDGNPRGSVGVHRTTDQVDAGEVLVEEIVDVSGCKAS